MKIVELTAENFKKLKAVQITPSGNVVQITGANDQGKSSVLDSIWAAIDAAGYLKETKTKEPVRQGEKKATIKLDLGELIITRKFLTSGATVEVATKDGACYKSPQQILDALIGKISFDPLAFSIMDEKKQKEMLLNMVKIDLDLKQNALDRDTVFSTRSDVNRTVKQLEGQLAGITAVPDDTPDEEKPAADVLSAQRKAQEVKEDYDRQRQVLRDCAVDYREKQAEVTHLEEDDKEIDVEIIELQDKIEALKRTQGEIRTVAAKAIKDLEAMKEKGLAMKEKVEALKDPDMTIFDTELADLEKVNANVRRKLQRQEVKKSLLVEEQKSAGYTEKISALDKAKNDAIKAAKFPVDGLGFDDNGVTYNGVPFTQSGSAVRLRVSIAMAMSMNPKLRVIRIADGSLLDSKNMAIIEEMAKEHDYQLWIEKVDESGKIGIVIEDGSVKGAEVSNG